MPPSAFPSPRAVSQAPPPFGAFFSFLAETPSRQKKTAALLLAALALAGCVQQKSPHPAPPALVDQSLRDAARGISEDLARLAGSRQLLGTPSGSGPLSEPADLVYDGPLTGALEKLCARTGFRLAVRGRPKTAPAFVHLRARGRPALELFRELGLQTGPYERLRLSEPERLAELVFLDPAEEAARTAKARGARP